MDANAHPVGIHEVKETEQLLRQAAKICKKRRLSLHFTWRDIGDLYHVYGVNATAARLVDMLVARERCDTPRHLKVTGFLGFR